MPLHVSRSPSRKVYFRNQYWLPVAYFVHLILTGTHPPVLPIPVRPPDSNEG